MYFNASLVSFTCSQNPEQDAVDEAKVSVCRSRYLRPTFIQNCAPIGNCWELSGTTLLRWFLLSNCWYHCGSYIKAVLKWCLRFPADTNASASLAYDLGVYRQESRNIGKVESHRQLPNVYRNTVLYKQLV